MGCAKDILNFCRNVEKYACNNEKPLLSKENEKIKLLIGSKVHILELQK